MWRNQRRWLAPGECYALCLVVWNQGSRAKRASEIQPKIPGDVFFLKTKQQWLHIYIQTCISLVTKRMWFTVPQIAGKQHCHILSYHLAATHDHLGKNDDSALSVWKLMMTPSAPARFRQNQPSNETQKIPKKPCVVNDHDHVRSPVHNKKIKKEVHHLKQVRHAAMFPNFLLRRFYKHLKVLPCSTNPVSKCFGDVFTAALPDKNPVRITFFVVAACDSHCEAQMGPASSAFLALVGR